MVFYLFSHIALFNLYPMPLTWRISDVWGCTGRKSGSDMGLDPSVYRNVTSAGTISIANVKALGYWVRYRWI